MPKQTSHAPGTFCWVDLATSDADGAKAFYTQLFGWTSEDMPTDQGVPYTMLRKGGEQVCAMFPLGPDMGDVPRWQSYITVTDANAAVESAEALGGRVLMPPMDVMQAGRLAMIEDPVGAVFGLWQAGEHAGSDLRNEPGALCWNELQTSDRAVAGRFYAGLFGWSTNASQSIMEGKYDIFASEGKEVGGMLQIEPDWGEVPPNWSVYFGVEDCDAAIAEATHLGGKPLFPAMEVENVGRFAFLQDPQGSVFAVIQLAHPV
ncbi:MAG: VOC family protein [Pseudomonadota bacterium]|nr:VOC family protein [Pseudomonadota bacterium]